MPRQQRFTEKGHSLKIAASFAAVALAAGTALSAGSAVFGQTPEGALASAEAAPLPSPNALLGKAARSLKDTANRLINAAAVATADGVIPQETAASLKDKVADSGLTTTDAKNVSHATTTAWTAIWDYLRPVLSAIWRPFADAWSRLFRAGTGDAAGAGISVKFSFDAATPDQNR